MWEILKQLGGLLGGPTAGGILGGAPVTTPPFNPAAGGGPPAPSAVPPAGGFMGKVNSALSPFGGALPVGVALLANSGGGGSFGSNLGRALSQSAIYNNQQQDRERDRRRDEALMRRYEAEEKERTATQRHRAKLNSIMSDPGAYEEGALERTLGKAYGRDPLATKLVDRQLAGSAGRTSLPEVESAYERARAEGYGKDFLTFVREYGDLRRGPQNQQPRYRIVEQQMPDGSVQRVWVDEAAGPGSPIKPFGAPQQPGGADKAPTEGERSSAGYLGRMRKSEKLLGTYVPSMFDYTAGINLMSGGPARSAFSNQLMSEEAQKYFQAASDWVRAKLRKESGAVIGADEMEAEIKTYFPVPGDSPAVVEQKRLSRIQAEKQLETMGGRAVSTQQGATSDDIDALLKKYGAR